MPPGKALQPTPNPLRGAASAEPDRQAWKEKVRLLLIEGLPGSGKTTTAGTLCRRMADDGVVAGWYLEESADHPVHPRSVTNSCDAIDFAAICLDRWKIFVEEARNNDVLHIMEGTAFQSTVRFMLERDSAGIPEYFSTFSDLVKPLSPAFVYLRPNDAVENSRYISKLRGEEWTRKVSTNETRTPFAKRNNFSGVEGMHAFWAEYAAL